MYKPDEECKIIIENIQLICRIKGIKANELAKKADIAPSTISYILNGKTKPQIYTLFQLCNALEITLEDLMSKAESTDSSQQTGNLKYYDESSDSVIDRMEIGEDERKLLSHYRYFSEKKKELLNLYMDMLRQHNEADE